MTNRIASFTQTNQLISSNLRLQGNYAEKQLQVSSGFKSDTYSGIARDTSRLLNLEGDQARIKQQTENANIAKDRLNLMWSATGNIITQTQNFAASLTATVSGLGSTGNDLLNIATTNINQFAGALNTQIADRYLFAGSATNTAPVDLTDPTWGGQTFTAPGPSVADTNYYQGNNYVQHVETVEGFTVNYGVTADNPAFEKVIRAYDLIITAPSDEDTQREALSLLQTGLDEMAVLQANMAQNAKVLENQIADNQEELKLLSEQISSLKEADVAEASIRLKQIETQLEASYSVTATLLNLKLSDYVR